MSISEGQKPIKAGIFCFLLFAYFQMLCLDVSSARLKHLSSAIRLNSNFKPHSKPIINLSPLSSFLHQCQGFKEFKQILSQMILAGFIKNKFDAKTLLKFSTDLPFIHLDYSLQIFNVIENPDTSMYNILMKAYVQRNYPHRAIHLYKLMLYRCVHPNVYTYPFLVEACAIRLPPHTYPFIIDAKACPIQLAQFEGKQVHNHVLKLGFDSDVHVRGTFVDFYADCWNIIDARKVFDEGPMMGSFVWYSLFDYYVQTYVVEAEKIYNMMPEKDIISSNSLIFNLKIMGMKEKFRQLVNEIPKTDTVSWSLLIDCYAQVEYYEEAITIFIYMHANGMMTDEFVVEAVLVCCTRLLILDDVVDMGKLIHGLVVKIGNESDVELQNSLICMYSQSEDILSAEKMFNAACWLEVRSWNFMLHWYAESNLVENARALFESMPEKDFSSWIVMIYHSYSFPEGLALFRRMLRSGIVLEMTNFDHVINRLASRFGALDLGKCIHAYLMKHGYHLDRYLRKSLWLMYDRCKVDCDRDLLYIPEKENLLGIISFSGWQ